jgi:hypothetical protein
VAKSTACEAQRNWPQSHGDTEKNLNDSRTIKIATVESYAWNGKPRVALVSAVCSEVGSDGAIYLDEFDRSASHLDERDSHSPTWAVRRNDDFLSIQSLL